MIINKEAILAGDYSQFNVLLKTCFAGAIEHAGNEQGAFSRAAIAHAIQAKSLLVDWKDIHPDVLLDEIDRQHGQQSVALKSEVLFALKVIAEFSGTLQLDSQLGADIESIKTLVLAHAIADGQFWLSDHPLKKTVNYLCAQMLVWDDTHGNISQSLRALFESSVTRLCAIPVSDHAAIAVFHREVSAEFTRLLDKFGRLASRLKDTEIGLLKAVSANNTVARFLNVTARGQNLPSDVAQFLQTKWLHEMQMLIIKQGVESPFWLRWKKLVETLVKYYQPDMQVGPDGASRNILLHLPDELEKLINESMPGAAGFEDFCNEIGYDLSQKLMGIELKGLQPVNPLPVEGDVAGVEKKVTQLLLNKAKAFTPGQWFICKNEDGKLLRCCLLFSMPEFDRLLFVNMAGQKSLVLDYEKFAYLLSGKYMQPLQQGSYLEKAFATLLDTLLVNFNELYETRQSLLKKKELEARQARAEHEKRMAAEKAREEAEAIARRKADEEQAVLLAKIADDMKRQARLALNSLALGSWVDMQDATTRQYRRIKLAVKYNATGRFVFVDADGVTVADCQRDDLVELIMKRKMKLLESDGLFADRLAKIVKDIRKV